MGPQVQGFGVALELPQGKVAHAVSLGNVVQLVAALGQATLREHGPHKVDGRLLVPVVLAGRQFHGTLVVGWVQAAGVRVSQSRCHGPLCEAHLVAQLNFDHHQVGSPVDEPVEQGPRSKVLFDPLEDFGGGPSAHKGLSLLPKAQPLQVQRHKVLDNGDSDVLEARVYCGYYRVFFHYHRGFLHLRHLFWSFGNQSR